MDVPEHMPLADLKKAIKEFKMNDTPKLSSKKAQLMEYAVKVGILKGKAAPVAEVKAEVKEVKAEPKAKKAKEPKAKEVAELPEALKAPKEKGKAKAAPAAAPAKKTSPFAAFMQQHKGQGLTMAELAAKYKEGK